ncbi:hypothetical protein QQG91_06360 [Marivivens sp. LCG002]|uniref:hypothetical protein n=1 Tax=Marivivens sp. LCG002 TaxID=3051171 RepID=UPI0025571C70|nr:hypothetical protein [Marivivens sp. LCG002]WIV52059.1 hypothetical protein QQG91_06360 [Marivivens sp. LCG002]
MTISAITLRGEDRIKAQDDYVLSHLLDDERLRDLWTKNGALSTRCLQHYRLTREHDFAALIAYHYQAAKELGSSFFHISLRNPVSATLEDLLEKRDIVRKAKIHISAALQGFTNATPIATKITETESAGLGQLELNMVMLVEVQYFSEAGNNNFGRQALREADDIRFHLGDHFVVEKVASLESLVSRTVKMTETSFLSKFTGPEIRSYYELCYRRCFNELGGTLQSLSESLDALNRKPVLRRINGERVVELVSVSRRSNSRQRGKSKHESIDEEVDLSWIADEPVSPEDAVMPRCNDDNFENCITFSAPTVGRNLSLCPQTAGIFFERSFKLLKDGGK